MSHKALENTIQFISLYKHFYHVVCEKTINPSCVTLNFTQRPPPLKLITSIKFNAFKTKPYILQYHIYVYTVYIKFCSW